LLTTILAFIFVLGVIVFVHELGHFVVARRNGIRVLTFSLGFGPKLLRVTRGGTEYCISAIPLGGYVKMAGENPDDPRAGRPDEFLSKTKWQRFQVLLAGSVMNILLALVVMTVVLYRGADVPAFQSQPPVVGSLVAGSPAEKSGIRVGDRILRVAGREVGTWERFFVNVMPKAGREIEVVVERGGERVTIPVTPGSRDRFEVGDIGVLPEMHPQIRLVNAGQAADRAGILVGDVLVGLDGRPVGTLEALVGTINGSAGKALRLTIRRGSDTRDVTVTPELRGGKGLIGVQFLPFEVRRIKPGPWQAVTMSVERNLEWSTLIFQTLGGLFSGEASPRQLVGPIGIAQLAGGAAQASFLDLFTLMAMISLNLGLINLLPIPVLDGGHIFILLVEGIARRDLSMKVKEQLLVAGFVVLMAVMVTVLYNDLMRIGFVERLVPWR
jgi:regulator of sigma E protease